eukprot:m.22338 g.22338  ORF g.22338 m.22338 type:complete len:332 (+) comp13779_c0_seq1:103-1098(+)
MAALRGFRALPSLSVADLMRLFKVPAKKSLSQNFILDENVADKFIKSAGDLTKAHVIEVGPGPGLLTRSILKAGAKELTLVEKDRRFIPFLQQLNEAAENRIQIYNEDILSFDYTTALKVPEEATDTVRIIGNLPFSIATPLLFQYLRMCCTGEGPFGYASTELTLCFQKEVADRMVAPPGSRIRCRISAMVQHCCEARIVYDLPKKVFVPSPKVDAAVVRLFPLPTLNELGISFDDMEVTVRAIFSSRRKTIRNNIRSALNFSDGETDEILEAAGIDGALRAQVLTTLQIQTLCRALKSKRDPIQPVDPSFGHFVSLSQESKQSRSRSRK